MNPEKKVKILNTAILSLIFGIIFTLLGEYVGMLEKAKALKAIGVPYSPALSEVTFSATAFWIPLIVGGLIGFAIVYFIPLANWGVALVFKMKAKPGGFWFNAVVGLIIAVVMVPILAVLMSILTTIILVPPAARQLTVSQAVIGGFKYLYLYLPAAWIVAMLVANKCEKLARKMLKVPAVYHGQPEIENK